MEGYMEGVGYMEGYMEGVGYIDGYMEGVGIGTTLEKRRPHTVR